MSEAMAFAGKLGALMMAHPDLFSDIVDLIEKGADPELIKKAIRDLKILVSDEAMKQELGV